MEPLYEWSIRLARPLIETGSVISARARRAVLGRRQSLRRLEEWARQVREPGLPVVWVHAPSVGESLMAQAIIAELRQRLRVHVAFTYFSPSAERVAENVGADLSAVLPWDVRRDMTKALELLAPVAIVFVRTDVWPVLTREARRRNVGLLLVNAPLGAASTRLKPPARTLLRAVYHRLDAVATVSAGDAVRFAALGVPAARTHVLGDARFDQVWARVHQREPRYALLDRLQNPDEPTIVAGSTWPEDEQRLVPAFARLRARQPIRLIIAPHQPSPAHLAGLERLLTRNAVSFQRLSDFETGAAPPPPALIVDRVGVLAQLYAAGRIAYVGGGFGRRGLHSVIEPAALGCPVLFGPRLGNAQEAAQLAAARGGVIVADSPSIEQQIERLLHDGSTGENAKEFVEKNLGAAARMADLIVGIIERRTTTEPPRPASAREG